MDMNEHDILSLTGEDRIRAAEEVDKARIARQDAYRASAIARQEAIATAHGLKNTGLDVKEISKEMRVPQSMVRTLLKQDPPERRYPVIVRDDTHASLIAGEAVRRHDSIKITLVLDTTEGGQFHMLGAAMDLELINAFKFEPLAVDWVADAATTEEVTETSEEVQDFFEEFDPNYNTNNYITDPSEGETPNV